MPIVFRAALIFIFLAKSHTPAYTARPRTWANVSHRVPAFTVSYVIELFCYVALL